MSTAWTMLALGHVGAWKQASEELDVARAWLGRGEAGRTLEWIAVTLLRAHAAGDVAVAKRWYERILADQNDDGGWGWQAGEPSNAFSTGQGLYVLATIQPRRGDEPAMRHAVTYLLETQDSQGRWDVPSARISAHAEASREVIYDYWGTAWATIGLARSSRAPQCRATPPTTDLDTNTREDGDVTASTRAVLHRHVSEGITDSPVRRRSTAAPSRCHRTIHPCWRPAPSAGSRRRGRTRVLAAR